MEYIIIMGVSGVQGAVTIIILRDKFPSSAPQCINMARRAPHLTQFVENLDIMKFLVGLVYF